MAAQLGVNFISLVGLFVAPIIVLPVSCNSVWVGDNCKFLASVGRGFFSSLIPLFSCEDGVRLANKNLSCYQNSLFWKAIISYHPSRVAYKIKPYRFCIKIIPLFDAITFLLCTLFSRPPGIGLKIGFELYHAEFSSSLTRETSPFSGNGVGNYPFSGTRKKMSKLRKRPFRTKDDSLRI